MELKEINKELEDNAKYFVTLRGDGDLLKKLFTDLFLKPYAAAQQDIYYRFYIKSKTNVLSCSLILKNTLDSHIEEVIEKYVKEKGRDPIIDRRVESKVQLLP